jgi:hypothetical protein
MKVDYRGFELSAKREQSLGGDELLYYFIMRKADGWMMDDSFTSGSEAVREYIKYLKERVDAYYLNPFDEFHNDLPVIEEAVCSLLYTFTPEQVGAFFAEYAKQCQKGED